MKKWMIIVLAVILSVVITLLAIVLALTGGFTKGVISNWIYRPQNVYDEIWNLLLTEEYTRNKTVLTSATKDAEEDWDLGIDFVGIHIPECSTTVCWWRNDGKELAFLFYGEESDAMFIYNYETKTLYGDADFSYLMENFLEDYFQWCADDPDFSSGYSLDSLGKHTFEYVNPIWTRELPD